MLPRGALEMHNGRRKWPEMTPEMEFSHLKQDFHHVLGLKAIKKGGKVFRSWNVA